MSIDIETFSDVDLGKCGVYKYAESPSFEILLFGYAVDGGDIHVVDLAQGEQIPKEILDTLTDDSVEKGELVKITTPIDLNRAELVSIKVMGAKKPRAQIGIDEIAFVP